MFLYTRTLSLIGIQLVATPAISAPLSSAQELIQLAEESFQQAEYEEALEIFQRVQHEHPELAHRPQLHWNIARCWEMLGHLESAISAFRHAEMLYSDEKRKRLAQDKISALEAQYFGSLTVLCPDGSEVAVGELPGPRPCPGHWKDIRPGLYAGEVRDGLGRTKGFQVEIAQGQAHKVSPTHELATPETTGQDLETGTETSSISIYDKTIVDEPALDVWPWPWIASGLSAAAFGGAIWFWWDGSEALDSAGQIVAGSTSLLPSDRPARISELHQRHQDSKLGYYLMLTTGSALAAAGVVLFYVDGANNQSISISAPPGGISVHLKW